MDRKSDCRSSGCSGMKRSDSELLFEEFFASEEDRKIGNKAEIFGGSESFHALFALENQEILSTALADNPFGSWNCYSKQSNFSAQIDSPSSICVGSPMSSNTPNGDDLAAGASSGSSHEQSDEDDPVIEAGSCEEIKNPMDIKRIKRKISNRKSAQRSRKRKQEHQVELEQEVEALRRESKSLFKQLVDATQQFKDSKTNNRVLRSDVEALRAKVKLAEGMLSGGSLTSSLSHLFQNYLNMPQDYTNNMTHIDHVTPIMASHGDNNSPYSTVSESPLGLENPEAFNSNVANGVVGADRMREIWTWDRIVAPVSK